MHHMPQMLTTTNVAEHLACDRSTVLRAIRCSELALRRRVGFDDPGKADAPT